MKPLLQHVRRIQAERALRGARLAEDTAAHRLARLRGELGAIQEVLSHYAALIATTDHTNDWWRYAELKQAYADAEKELLGISAQVERAKNVLTKASETCRAKA